MKPEILRNIFLAIFVASTGLLVLLSNGRSARDIFSEFAPPSQMPATATSVPVATDEPGSTDTPNPISTPVPANPPPPSTKTDFGALIGTIITSVTSLVGFATTTVITWRREKRDASLADVERKKLETELEKSKLELEELKKGRGKKEGRRKK
ncbi:MAG: hypothetical protein HZB18_11835 [Chloroflexi bacterium]|nr:hypothetical protein [Chloroflexota bacterium]